MDAESWNVPAKRKRSDRLSSSSSEGEWLDDTWYTYSTHTDSYHPLADDSLRLLNEDGSNTSVSSHSSNEDYYTESSLHSDNTVENENTDNENLVIKEEKLDTGFNGENTSPNTPNMSRNDWIETILHKDIDNQIKLTPGTTFSTIAQVLLKEDTKPEYIPDKSKMIVTVPIPNTEAESITEALILLGNQNFGLITEKWTLVHDKSNRLDKFGYVVAFAIDQQSFAALRAINFRASLGFKKVNFQVKKND